jgi:hypothetical protein
MEEASPGRPWELSLRGITGATTVPGRPPCITGVAIIKLWDLRSKEIGVPSRPVAFSRTGPAARSIAEPFAIVAVVTEANAPP